MKEIPELLIPLEVSVSTGENLGEMKEYNKA